MDSPRVILRPLYGGRSYFWHEQKARLPSDTPSTRAWIAMLFPSAASGRRSRSTRDGEDRYDRQIMFLGGLFWLAVILWGIYKYSNMALDPVVNAKCARSMVIALGGWGIVDIVRIARAASSGPLSHGGKVADMVAMLVAMLVALIAVVVAVRGLREIARATVPGELDAMGGRGPAKWALVLSGLVIVVGAIGAAADVAG